MGLKDCQHFPKDFFSNKTLKMRPDRICTLDHSFDGAVIVSPLPCCDGRWVVSFSSFALCQDQASVAKEMISQATQQSSQYGSSRMQIERKEGAIKACLGSPGASLTDLILL